MVRLKRSHCEAALATSGSAKLWLDTPSEMQRGTRLVWLRNTQREPLSLTETRERVAELHGHLGLIAKRADEGWHYAARVKEADFAAAKDLWRQDATDAYLCRGLPPHASCEDLSDLLTQIGWQATVVEGSRRIARGQATYTVR
eukprot:3841720-Amphidinium_carterae.1